MCSKCVNVSHTKDFSLSHFRDTSSESKVAEEVKFSNLAEEELLLHRTADLSGLEK